MSVYHATATVEANGKLTLTQLPFSAGERVEVLVVPTAASFQGNPSLHGTLVHYDHPTDPVAVEDWEASQ